MSDRLYSSGETVRTLDKELAASSGEAAGRAPGGAIGLSLAAMPRLEQATGGLRGLMLLAAAPNVGKTALGVQLGLAAVEADPDACFLFLSLEMPRQEIITRLTCNLARLDWARLMLNGEAGMSGEEREALAEARARLNDLGRRIMILDAYNSPEPTLEGALAHLNELKRSSGARRALILVDYLQVFPLPREVRRDLGIVSDQDADRWRIGAMKELRDLAGEAVLVISEVEKPAQGRRWAQSLEDITGSARGIYTPDMVFLLQAMDEESAAAEIGGNPQEALATLRRVGMSFNHLVIAKGRDGVTRTGLELTFFYRQSRFVQGFRRLF